MISLQTIVGQCGAYPNSPIEYFLNWRFIDGVTCTFGDQIGVGVTMLLFFMMTGLGLYQASGSVLVPIAALIILAPLTMALLPAIGFQFTIVIIFVGLAGAGMYLYMAASGR